MAHTDAAIGHGGFGTPDRGRQAQNVSLVTAVGAAAFAGPAAALAVGVIGAGLVSADKDYEAARGQSLGEDFYDWTHQTPPASEEKKEETKTTTTTSGTAADAGQVSGKKDEDEDKSSGSSNASGGSGTDGGSSTEEAGTSSTSGSSESSESKGSTETKESSDKTESKSDADEKSESGADPEVGASYRYPPTMDEVQRQFGSNATRTTGRSSPNPANEGASGVTAAGSRTLTGTTDVRLVNPDGHLAQVGTAAEFGSTHIEGLGTVRPADTSGGEGVVRPRGGYNPAA